MTEDPLRSLHAVILGGPGALDEPVRRVFEARFVRQHAGEDWLDWRAAAVAHYERKEWLPAARAYKRLLSLDPEHLEVRLRIGECCIDGGRPGLAATWLREGLAMGPDSPLAWDFEFQLGRAAAVVGRLPEALAHYESSAARRPHPDTFANIGVIHQLTNQPALAYGAYRRALALNPRHERSLAKIEQLKQSAWDEAVKQFESPVDSPK